MENLSTGDRNGGSGWGFALAAGSAALVAVVKAFVVGYYNRKKEYHEHQNFGWGWGYFAATGTGAVLLGIAAYTMVYFSEKKRYHQGETESAIDIGTRKPMKILKCGHTFHENSTDSCLKKNVSDCLKCADPQ